MELRKINEGAAAKYQTLEEETRKFREEKVFSFEALCVSAV